MDFLRRLLGQQPDDEPEPEPAPPPAPAEDEPEVEEFMEVGGSPLPGLTLRAVLRGHTSHINRIAWSPNGEILASPSADNTIRLWNPRTGTSNGVLDNSSGQVFSVDWSIDGRYIISGDGTGYLKVWNVSSRELVHSKSSAKNSIRHAVWSPDGNYIALGGDSSGGIDIINGNDWGVIHQLKGEYSTIYSVQWTNNSDYLFFGTLTGNIEVFDVKAGKHAYTISGHSGPVFSLSISNNNKYIASGSQDNSIKIWDVQERRLLATIEGHANAVESVDFSADDVLLASIAEDNTVRLWQVGSWEQIAVITKGGTIGWASVAFHPNNKAFASVSNKKNTIRIWDINYDLLVGNVAPTKSVHYTTAKVVLVGDSGVGKTGLGWRLAHGQFKEHASTHGQQFWVVGELGKTRDDGTQCEAVVWDLAGQHVYRQVHALFLDDVDASLVLFDPTNRQDPLKGAQFWLEQLRGKAELPPTVLVGARVDRGAPVLSRDELEQFCRRYGISGGYLSTSAMTGAGVEQLLATLKAQIPWDKKPATVTTITFKRIKDYVLALKASTERKGVLVQHAELRQQLEASDPEWQFSDAELTTAVGHLQNHGYVTLLQSAAGETHILLLPELLVSLASSIVLQADRHVRELGAVSETELLQGNYPLEELEGLELAEQQILLDAAVQRFLEHAICFRETLGSDTLLIFPGLIKQKRPLLDDAPITDDISYIVRGRVENIYAMLVVLLGYTPTFTRINQWQSQAQYELGSGQICGFRMIEEREGEIELVLYYGDRMPQAGRDSFLALFERFLYQRDVEVTRFPPVVCPQGHRQKRATVIERIREDKRFTFCDECGSRVELPSLERPGIGMGASGWLQREEAIARLQSLYEANLVHVKSYRRGWAMPRCYLSYAPGEAARERLVHDLQNAGVFLVERPEQVQPADFVLILDTPAFRQAWNAAPQTLGADLAMIRARLAGDKQGLLSVAIGDGDSSPFHDLASCKPGDFRDESHYAVGLFDLVLTLYAIPLTHAAFLPLRRELHQRWEQMPRAAAAADGQPAPPAGRKSQGAPSSRKQKPEAAEYLDFDLHIAPDGRALARSDEGDEPAQLSLTPPRGLGLALPLIRQGVVDTELYQEAGRELYDWLFPGAIHTHLQKSETRARLQGAKLRLRLRVEPPAIAALPLELLYRAERGAFMATNPDTVLSRYIQLGLPPERVRRRPGPLHMLAIIAAPADQQPIDAGAWETMLRQALAAPLAAGQLTLDVVRDATREAIRDALLAQEADIVQFVGHGFYAGGRGALALVDSAGKTWRLDDAQFADLFVGHDARLGLIGLAACESASSDDPQGFLGVAPQLVQRSGVPAVVAMQYKVSIPIAQVFFADLYTALAARKPLDWSVQAARKAVSLVAGPDTRDFAAPVLFMRAQDGKVF